MHHTRKRKFDGAGHASGGWIEPLESRRLLAALPAAVPAHIIEKIDARLWDLVQGLGPRPVAGITPLQMERVDPQGRIHVNIRTTGSTDALERSLGQLGAKVSTSLKEHRVTEAWVPPDRVDDVARLVGVSAVRLPDYRVTNVTSAGDAIHNADNVRSQFLDYGINGDGIRIGVISDGVDHRASVGSELPAISVDPSLPGGGDEGTAILEIVHDLAPGAQLFFSGPLTSVDMVSSINWLVGQGCDVIVDDLSFFGESFFSDSDIAVAAANAVNSGVVYVTSAGNYSDRQHYQGQFLEGARFGNPNSQARYHRFSTGPNDDFNDISIPPGGFMYVFLEWSDPWGTSGNNYDLFLTTTSGSTVASSTTMQNGNDLPWEAIGVQNNGASTFNGHIRIVKRGGAAVRELEMFTYGHADFQHFTIEDALIGHAAVEGVMSVAAAWASTPTTVESFSSRGGSTIYTNFATQSKIVRQTLDGTAIDGVQTRVGQLGFFSNPFFGTSAAAPHAAAVAALVLQTDPTLTPAQVSQVMADTATDLSVPGYDTTSGAGLYNALDAVYKLFTPDSPDLTAATDSGLLDTDNITNNPLPTFTGTAPAGSYVRLFVGDVVSNALQLGPAESNYSISPAAALSDGDHLITIRVAADSAVAIDNLSNASPALEITIDTQAPALDAAAFNFDAAVQNITFTFSEDISGTVEVTDLSLVGQTTGAIPGANISAAMSSGNLAVFTFPGYPFGALPDDFYIATLAAGSVGDLAGNLSPIELPLNFFYLSGDFNHDGAVNRIDLTILAMNWQLSSRTFTTGDATYDGLTDLRDLYEMSLRWGITFLLF